MFTRRKMFPQSKMFTRCKMFTQSKMFARNDKRAMWSAMWSAMMVVFSGSMVNAALPQTLWYDTPADT